MGYLFAWVYWYSIEVLIKVIINFWRIFNNFGQNT